jgi:hypothetical protein
MSFTAWLVLSQDMDCALRTNNEEDSGVVSSIID